MRSRVRAAVLSLVAIMVTGAAWKPGISGVEWGELRIRGAHEAWRTRL